MCFWTAHLTASQLHCVQQQLFLRFPAFSCVQWCACNSTFQQLSPSVQAWLSMDAWVTATDDDLLMPATASYLAKPSTTQQHDAIKKYQPAPTVTLGSRQAPRPRAICRVLQSKVSHQTRDRHLILRIAHTPVQWLLAQSFGCKPIEAWLLINPSVPQMRL